KNRTICVDFMGNGRTRRRIPARARIVPRHRLAQASLYAPAVDPASRRTPGGDCACTAAPAVVPGRLFATSRRDRGLATFVD
ncbi:uncharacterized protein TRAVEDRAFT_26665, partial [Trametes versicolor FP-101664 SS1]|uniref:uncharacterized protein n=1 Tax=Trametes versicolor (strain FP-101664) TaxID=717944 RepID=UPI0004624582